MSENTSTDPLPAEHPPLRLTRVLLITLLVLLAIFLLVPDAPQSSTQNSPPEAASGLASAEAGRVP